MLFSKTNLEYKNVFVLQFFTTTAGFLKTLLPNNCTCPTLDFSHLGIPALWEKVGMQAIYPIGDFCFAQRKKNHRAMDTKNYIRFKLAPYQTAY